jgi:hypothetical protein
MERIAKTDLDYFFEHHPAALLFDALYKAFEEEFEKGKIILGGSLYYHIMGMSVNRAPGDIDLIIDHRDRDFRRQVSYFFDQVGDGIIKIESMNSPIKQIGIPRMIHHSSKVRIEISQGIFDGIFQKKIRGYNLFHFEPEKIIRNIFLYFRLYLHVYAKEKAEGNQEKADLFVFKTRKMYSNILIIADYYGIDYAYLRSTYEQHLKRIYAILDKENVHYLNLFTLEYFDSCGTQE